MATERKGKVAMLLSFLASVTGQISEVPLKKMGNIAINKDFYECVYFGYVEVAVSNEVRCLCKSGRSMRGIRAQETYLAWVCLSLAYICQGIECISQE